MAHGAIPELVVPLANGQKAPRTKHRGMKAVLYYTPLFTFALIYYLVLKFVINDLQVAVPFTYGDFKVTWAQTIYVLSFLFFALELLKVSRKQQDNTTEVNWMMGAAIVLFIIPLALTAGAWIAAQRSGVPDPDVEAIAHFLFNTDFVFLTAQVSLLLPIAYRINTATSQMAVV